VTPLRIAWLAFADSPVFGLLAALLAYDLALRLQRWLGGNALANPVLVGTLLLIGLLKATGVSYAAYLTGAGLILLMLSPATVALAVPLYTHVAQLQRSAVRLCLAAGLGATVAAASAVGIAASLGASDAVLRSIAPRSATTAIAVGVSERIGGQPGLTAAMVIISGIIGAVIPAGSSMQRTCTAYDSADWPWVFPVMPLPLRGPRGERRDRGLREHRHGLRRNPHRITAACNMGLIQAELGARADL
jgi:putative effector of murein hydrolase